ncbi:hypothetical protein [Deinococcus aestuarii]|uniref:Y-family DNA polymerase n=1 Tax=Deinococcus aestuarii TaxID=2774531 RepID=UPI001C0C02E0|nr:hypothetical protein [Deinococcus aestuarii]
MTRLIVQVDMDAFYASVEVRDQPELREKPVVVIVPGRRGVVVSANDRARGFGVHELAARAATRTADDTPDPFRRLLNLLIPL